MSSAAVEFFEQKLQFETDPADAWEDLRAGKPLVIVDARSEASYARRHIAGAINIPHRTMNGVTTARLDRSLTYVVYCDGIGCNASTKGSRNLAALGFDVREMIGGIEWRVRDGFPVEGDADTPIGEPAPSPAVAGAACPSC